MRILTAEICVYVVNADFNCVSLKLWNQKKKCAKCAHFFLAMKKILRHSQTLNWVAPKSKLSFAIQELRVNACDWYY